MKDNMIAQRINAIVSVAEQNAAENCILENWYNQTVVAARQIKEQIDSKVTEFENLSLALSALQGNVPVITVDLLYEGIEALYKSIDAYVAYPETAYGFAIQTTKDAIRNTGSIIYESIQSLSVLERAMGICEKSAQIDSNTDNVEETPVDEGVTNTEEETTAEPEEPEKTEEQLNITLEAEGNGFRVGFTKEAEKEPEHEEATTEPDKTVEQSEDKDYLNDNRTLFGVPVSDLKKMTPGVNVDNIIGQETKKPAETPKAENEEDAPPVGFIWVDIPGFPKHQFMLSNNNMLVDNLTKRRVRTFRQRGEDYVSLIHWDTRNREELKFDDIVRAARGIQTESATATTSKEVETEVRWVWVNWYRDIPKTKYKVYEDGRVWNTVDSRWMGCGLNKSIIQLTSGDAASRTPGVQQSVIQLTRQSLVVRAFHPEAREKTKIYVKFKDGNTKNCALSNLEFKI